MKSEHVHAICVGCAAVASAGALLLVIDPGRLVLELAASPFGWNRVIVIQVLATLPLAWFTAAILASLLPRVVAGGTTGAWIACGLALAAATVLWGASVGTALDGRSAGFAARLVVRSCWPLVLQIPWCVAGHAQAPIDSMRRMRGGSKTVLVLLALFLGVAAPATYLDRLMGRQTAEAAEMMRSSRIDRSVSTLTWLADIGSQRLVEFSDPSTATAARLSPVEARVLLSRTVARLANRIRSLENGPLNQDERMELASHFASIGQADKACEILEPVASESMRAAMLMAKCLQEDQHWEQSTEWLHTALSLAQEESPPDTVNEKVLVELQAEAYDLLAYNARELQNYERAEQYYHEALSRLPSKKGHFHAQLGKHYKLGGRSFKAAQHQRTAHEIAPDIYSAPDAVFLAAGLLVSVFVYVAVQEFVLSR